MPGKVLEGGRLEGKVCETIFSSSTAHEGLSARYPELTSECASRSRKSGCT